MFAEAQSWGFGLDLFEVSRVRVIDANDRLGNLLETLGSLDDGAAKWF